MTLDDLLAGLSAFDADMPLIFAHDSGPIGDGYHVTEIKHAAITSIDCGGRIAEWTQAGVQLLDGQGGGHMPVDKFRAILGQSLQRISGLGAVPAHVEFAPDNAGLRLYDMAAPEAADGGVIIMLSEQKAQCKPFVEMARKVTGAACCSRTAPAGACCG